MVVKAQNGTWNERLVNTIAEKLTEYFDETDVIEALNEEIDLEELVKEIIDEDPTIRQSYRAKVKDLLLDQIKGLESFEDIDDSFDPFDHLPEGFQLDDIVEDLFKNDEDLKKKLGDSISELLKEAIESIDESDLPEWSEIWEMLNLGELIKGLVGNDSELEGMIVGKIKEAIEEQIDQDWNSEEFADAIHEALQLDQLVPEILRDRVFLQGLMPKLKDSIAEDVVRLYSGADEDSGLYQIIKDDPNLKAITQYQLQELLRDQTFISKVEGIIRSQMLTNDRLAKFLMDNMFGEMAKLFATRMLQSLQQ